MVDQRVTGQLRRQGFVSGHFEIRIDHASAAKGLAATADPDHFVHLTHALRRPRSGWCARGYRR